MAMKLILFVATVLLAGSLQARPVLRVYGTPTEAVDLRPAWEKDGRWQAYNAQEARLQALAARERNELNLLGRLTTLNQAQAQRRAYLAGLLRLQEDRMAVLERMKMNVQTEYQLRDLAAKPVVLP